MFGEARLGGNLVIFAVYKLSGHSGIVEFRNSTESTLEKALGYG